MNYKSKILTIIMLVLFGIPGIFSEGLHSMLPNGFGMIFHVKKLPNNDSQSPDSIPQPYPSNNSCPICHFCSIFLVYVYAFVILIDQVKKGTVQVLYISHFHFTFFNNLFKRGPPSLSVC